MISPAELVERDQAHDVRVTESARVAKSVMEGPGPGASHISQPAAEGGNVGKMIVKIT